MKLHTFTVRSKDGEIVGLIGVSRSWPRRWYATDGESEWRGTAPTLGIATSVALRRAGRRSRGWGIALYLRILAEDIWEGAKDWHRANQKMFELPADGDFRGHRVDL